MTHCFVTKRENTRTFTDICSRYYCNVKVRKFNKDQDVTIVTCGLWTWIKIRFYYWIFDPDIKVEEEIEGTI